MLVTFFGPGCLFIASRFVQILAGGQRQYQCQLWLRMCLSINAVMNILLLLLYNMYIHMNTFTTCGSWSPNRKHPLNQRWINSQLIYDQPTIDRTFHWDAATWQHRISQQTNLGEWSFQHFTNLGVRLYIFCEHSIDTSTSFGEDDIPMISRHLMFFLNCSNHAKSPSDTHGVFSPFLGSTTQDAGSSPPRVSMNHF